jgi:hypothetical protein
MSHYGREFPGFPVPLQAGKGDLESTAERKTQGRVRSHNVVETYRNQHAQEFEEGKTGTKR